MALSALLNGRGALGVKMFPSNTFPITGALFLNFNKIALS
jgi:hypothetical protein